MDNLDYSQLSIVIPAKNEAKTIESVVRQFQEAMPGVNFVLVDNNSSDGTFEIIKKLKAYPIKEMLPGKGRAMLRGLSVVHTKYVLFHDADTEYIPKDSIELFKLQLQHPEAIIVGNRTFPNKSSSYWANKFMQTLLALRLINTKALSLDILSGTRMGPTSVIKNMHLKAPDFRIETEFTKKALQANHFILSTPVTYCPRGYDEGKKIKPSDIWGLIREAIF